MVDYSQYKQSLQQEKSSTSELEQISNPLASVNNKTSSIIPEYSQEQARASYDSDIAEILEVVRILNNLAPLKMPVYNFNLDEINGERYYKPDGTLLLIREYDSDVIRDYYAENSSDNNPKIVNRILEHDKITGRLRTKITEINRSCKNAKINVTIFDEKLNNKYTIMQLSEDGTVNNITEFTGKGKSFQALFRNVYTFKPVRYLEGKDAKDGGFEMIDCIFDSAGKIARIKKYSNKKEVVINYTDNTKSINVKNKLK